MFVLFVIKIALKLASIFEYGVISAFVEGGDNNLQRHDFLCNELKDLGYSPVNITGEWEGHKELSVLVPNISMNDLITLGKKYNQDAVVYSCENKPQIINL